MSLTISNQVQLQQAAHSDKPEKKEGLAPKDIIIATTAPILFDVNKDMSAITERTVENHDKMVEEYGTVGAWLMGGWPMSAGFAIGEHITKEAFELGQKIKNGLEEAWNWVKGL